MSWLWENSVDLSSDDVYTGILNTQYNLDSTSPPQQWHKRTVGHNAGFRVECEIQREIKSN